DNWDKDTGRIYRLAPKGLKPATGLNLAKKSSDQLVDLLSNPNAWYVREARRILGERQDRSVGPRLRKLLEDRQDQLALEALWALYVSGGLSPGLALKLLDHASEDVRAWTIRLLGDDNKVPADFQKRLVALARQEKSAVVRNQLASTCKRLSGAQALPIVAELIRRNEDVGDPQIPMLLWWAIEAKAISDRAAVLDLLAKKEVWQVPLARQFLADRLARRYAAEGTEAGVAACAGFP